MYLAVQRVRSPRRDRGINGALYLHRSTRCDPRWSPPDLHAVKEQGFGEQVISRVEVAPGGNAIEGSLEVACPDDVSAEELRDALELFCRDLRKEHQLGVYGPFAFELSVYERAEQETLPLFTELREAAVDLFSRPREQPWLQQAPLVVQVEASETGWRFVLEDTSRRRLAAHFGEHVRPAPVFVPFDVAQDFQRQYGELYPFVVEWITSKPRHELLPLGGVRLIEEGATVWEWPRRAV